MRLQNRGKWKRLPGRWLFLLVVIWSAVVWVYGGSSASPLPPKSITVPHAGVASANYLASRVGVEMMRQGGNAADAATAVAMALAVVHPEAGNLGGGGFLLYRQQDGMVYALDFRETAPGAATPDMYLDAQGNPIPEKSVIGGLAVGVPGTVRGFYHFHQKFGKLPWAQVLQPAIDLAEQGFILDEYQVNLIKAVHRDLEKFPSSRKEFLPDGKLPRVGERFYRKNLGRTLRTLALHGDRPFYEGEIAREIVKSVRMHGGILSLEDLKNYRAVERQALVFPYRQYTVIAMPPPSSGGVVLQGLLQSLQLVDMREYPLHSARQIAFLTELEKRYFALRNRYLGDPDFVPIPLQAILSPELSQRFVQEIDVQHPTPSSRINPEELLYPEGEHTTHFSVVDARGNAVSVTYTLNDIFGSRLVAGNTGVLLNDEMDDFAAKPGTPNMFGLVQGEANRIEPGKRMLSSMCPVIVEKDGELAGLWGAPGGPRIISEVFLVLLNLVDYHKSLPEAVELGRFHHQWLPDSIFIEMAKFNPRTIDTLRQWGYGFKNRKKMGDVQAIWRTEEGWAIVSDPRYNGYPAGY